MSLLRCDAEPELYESMRCQHLLMKHLGYGTRILKPGANLTELPDWLVDSALPEDSCEEDDVLLRLSPTALHTLSADDPIAAWAFSIRRQMILNCQSCQVEDYSINLHELGCCASFEEGVRLYGVRTYDSLGLPMVPDEETMMDLLTGLEKAYNITASDIAALASGWNVSGPLFPRSEVFGLADNPLRYALIQTMRQQAVRRLCLTTEMGAMCDCIELYSRMSCPQCRPSHARLRMASSPHTCQMTWTDKVVKYYRSVSDALYPYCYNVRVSEVMKYEMQRYEQRYYDPSSSGSYGGVERLWREVRGRRRDVKAFLKSQKTYQLHKPRRRRYPRRRYVVGFPDDLWQADLADMQNVKTQNGGYSFLLVVIDVFSKFLWVRPLKKKTATMTVDAIDDIITSSQRKPKNFMTDQGTEFVNENARVYFQNVGINAYTSNNPETKAAVAERVIRTLKSRIYRYMTKNATKRYIDALQDIVDAYNNSYHRSIKMKPVEVTDETEEEVRKNLYPLTLVATKPNYKFAVSDFVRISITPATFGKGYLPKWSEEIFTVAKQIDTIPPTYKLKDEDGRVIAGSFYEPEMQGVILPEDRSPSPEL